MKINQIICPKCKSSLTSKAGIEEGTPINCPKCKNKFNVASTPKDDDVDDDFEVVDEDEEEAPRKPVSKVASKPLPKRSAASDDDDDEEEETPRKPAAKQGQKPLSKRGRDDDDEEDEEETPRKPAAKSSSKPVAKRKPADDEEDDDDRPKKGSKAFVALNRDDDDDEDDRPARKQKGRNDEDEDDAPRAKRKSRVVDDDDEDRPRRRDRDDDDDDDNEPKSGYAKLKKNVYVRASVLGGLLVIMGVLGYILWDQKFRKKDDDPAKNKDDASQPLVRDDRQPTGKKPQDNPKDGNRHAGPNRVHVAAQGFSIVKPADWQQGPSIAGSFLVLRGPQAMFQANLNVRTLPYDGTPLANIGAQIKEGLPKLFPSFKFVEEGPVTIDGQPGFFMIYTMRPELKGAPALDIKTMQYLVVSTDKKKAFILTFTDLASSFDSRRKTYDDMAATVRTD